MNFKPVGTKRIKSLRPFKIPSSNRTLDNFRNGSCDHEALIGQFLKQTLPWVLSTPISLWGHIMGMFVQFHSVLVYLASGIFYDIPYKVLFFFSSLFIKYSQKPWLKTKAMIPAYWKTTLKTSRTFGMNDRIFSLQSLIQSHPFLNIYIEIMAVHLRYIIGCSRYSKK